MSTAASSDPEAMRVPSPTKPTRQADGIGCVVHAFGPEASVSKAKVDLYDTLKTEIPRPLLTTTVKVAPNRLTASIFMIFVSPADAQVVVTTINSSDPTEVFGIKACCLSDADLSTIDLYAGDGTLDLIITAIDQGHGLKKELNETVDALGPTEEGLGLATAAVQQELQSLERLHTELPRAYQQLSVISTLVEAAQVESSEKNVEILSMLVGRSMDFKGSGPE